MSSPTPLAALPAMPVLGPHAVRLRYTRPPANSFAMLAGVFKRPTFAAPDAQHPLQFHATWQGAQATPQLLQRYLAVCELPASATLPLLYVHAMAMPLHLAIMSHSSFPLRVMGLVHWTNQTESLRPIPVGAVMDIACAMSGITPSDRGVAFSLHTTVRVGGELAWQEVSTFLRPAKRDKSGQARPPSGAQPQWSAPLAQWAVPANAGRRFAEPAGDWNPIHISALTARLFGYPRAIAHGMFSAARCLALLQGDQPVGERVRFDVRFKRPLLLPGAVALHTAHEADATRFVLRVLPGGEPHLEGVLG